MNYQILTNLLLIKAARAIANNNTNHTDYYENIRAYGWVALGNIYWYMVKSISDQQEVEDAALCMINNGSKTDSSGISHTCQTPQASNTQA